MHIYNVRVYLSMYLYMYLITQAPPSACIWLPGLWVCLPLGYAVLEEHSTSTGSAERQNGVSLHRLQVKNILLSYIPWKMLPLDGWKVCSKLNPERTQYMHIILQKWLEAKKHWLPQSVFGPFFLIHPYSHPTHQINCHTHTHAHTLYTYTHTHTHTCTRVHTHTHISYGVHINLYICM